MSLIYKQLLKKWPKIIQKNRQKLWKNYFTKRCTMDFKSMKRCTTFIIRDITLRYHFSLGTLINVQSLTLSSAGKAVRKQALSFTAGGSAKHTSQVAGTLPVANQTKQALIPPPRNPAFRNLPWRHSFNGVKMHMDKVIHCSIICICKIIRTDLNAQTQKTHWTKYLNQFCAKKREWWAQQI